MIQNLDIDRLENIKNTQFRNTLSKLRVPYPLKSSYNSVIPLNIFQTWHRKDFLPEEMLNTINHIKNLNPKFTYYLFDDKDCRKFIKNNFDSSVVEAFDCLIPGAYKADLWRYCVLYKKGGIYLDIKYRPYNNFRFISLTEKEHFCLDVDKENIYNALMVCKAGNDILLKAINQIAINVKNRYYGNSPLDITGPGLLASYFTSSEKRLLDMHHEAYNANVTKFVFLNDYIVCMPYNGYTGHFINSNTPHYSEYYSKRNIYHTFQPRKAKITQEKEGHLRII